MLLTIHGNSMKLPCHWSLWCQSPPSCSGSQHYDHETPDDPNSGALGSQMVSWSQLAGEWKLILKYPWLVRTYSICSIYTWFAKLGKIINDITCNSANDFISRISIQDFSWYDWRERRDICLYRYHHFQRSSQIKTYICTWAGSYFRSLALLPLLQSKCRWVGKKCP